MVARHTGVGPPVWLRKLAERLGKDWRAEVVGMAALPTALVRGTGDAGGQWWRLDLSAGDQAAISRGDAAALQVRDVPARMSSREGFKIYTHHRWFACGAARGRREGEATVLAGAQEQSSCTKGGAATYGSA